MLIGEVAERTSLTVDTDPILRETQPPAQGGTQCGPVSFTHERLLGSSSFYPANAEARFFLAGSEGPDPASRGESGRLRVRKVWCDWDPKESDLEEINEHINAGEAICTKREVVNVVDRPQDIEDDEAMSFSGGEEGDADQSQG